MMYMRANGAVRKSLRRRDDGPLAHLPFLCPLPPLVEQSEQLSPLLCLTNTSDGRVRETPDGMGDREAQWLAVTMV